MPLAFFLPALVILIFLLIYPFAISIYLSFHKSNYLYSFVESRFVGLRNYILLCNDPVFRNSVVVTLIYAAGSVAVEISLGIGIALLLYHQFKGGGLIRALCILPMMVTPVCVSLMWKQMLAPVFGIINYLLGFIGIYGLEWHASIKLALPTVIMIDIWQMTSFMVVILLAGLSSLSPEILEAAKIDGASIFQKFRYITLPLLRPVIVIAVLLRTLDVMKTFDKVWILTKGGPIRATELINIYVYRDAFLNGNLGHGASASMVIVIVIFVICLPLLKATGVKYY